MSPGVSAAGLSDEQILAEAQFLDAAERERRQIRQTTSVYPHMSIEEAYRVQAAWLDLRLEVELAFVLAHDLSGAGLDVDDVLDATDHVTGAVELIAARSFRTDPETGRTRTVVDTIADNAADAGIVTGGSPVAPRGLDLRWVGAIAYRNGVVEETGLAAAVLDHPANGVVWLARRWHSNTASILTMAKTWASSSRWVPKTGLRIGATVLEMVWSPDSSQRRHRDVPRRRGRNRQPGAH